MTTYRLTLIDTVNQAELPRVIYLEGVTRLVVQRRAEMVAYKTETIVDLVPLD